MGPLGPGVGLEASYSAEYKDNMPQPSPAALGIHEDAMGIALWGKVWSCFFRCESDPRRLAEVGIPGASLRVTSYTAFSAHAGWTSLGSIQGSAS